MITLVIIAIVLIVLPLIVGAAMKGTDQGAPRQRGDDDA
jgi:hypothetical protein